MLRTRLLQWWLVISLVMLPLTALANEENNTTTTTTVPEDNTTTTTTTTTIPEWEQSTDIELPEDTLNSQGNEVENNICLLYTSDAADE